MLLPAFLHLAAPTVWLIAWIMTLASLHLCNIMGALLLVCKICCPAASRLVMFAYAVNVLMDTLGKD